MQVIRLPIYLSPLGSFIRKWFKLVFLFDKHSTCCKFLNHFSKSLTNKAVFGYEEKGDDHNCRATPKKRVRTERLRSNLQKSSD